MIKKHITLILLFKCLIFGNFLFGQISLNQYNFPLEVKKGGVSILEIQYGAEPVLKIFTLQDSIVFKGEFTILVVDNSKWSTDSVAYVQKVLNWYSNQYNDNDVGEKESLLVYDYFDNGMIDKIESDTGKCYGCSSVYLCVYKRRLFSKKYKCVKREQILKYWW